MPIGHAGLFRFQPTNIKRQVSPLYDANFASDLLYFMRITRLRASPVNGGTGRFSDYIGNLSILLYNS
jgi:hypothetical protein